MTRGKQSSSTQGPWPASRICFANGGTAAVPAERARHFVAGRTARRGGGSSGNPISDQAPRDFQLAPQPINNVVVPGGINNENNTSLFKKEGSFIFVPPPQAAPPPPEPTISLTAIAITNPSSATSIVNASAAHAGFPIIGTTSGVEDGRTVTITIVNSSNQVVYSGTTTVTNGNWSVEISSAAASFIPDGSYTVIADVSDAAGHPALPATKSVTVDTVAAPPPVLGVIAASDSGSSTTDNITNNSTPTVTGSGAEAGALVTLYDSDGTTVLGTTTADVNGTWTITSLLLTDGDHALTVKQTDIAGNISGASSVLGVHIDTLRSTATIVVADTALAGETTLVTFTFGEAVNGFTNADLTVENGTLSAVSSSDGGVTWTATFTPSSTSPTRPTSSR